MKIYLDVDGVLANLVPHLYRRLGVPQNLLSEAYWRSTSYCPHATLRHYVGYESPQAMWTAVDFLGSEFWASTPLTKHAKLLVSVCEGFGHVELLTHSKGPMCTAGKAEWAARHFPWLKAHIVIEGISKAEYCAHGDVLIDDYVKNVEEWREVGGHAIQYPCPWNSASLPHRPARWLYDQLLNAPSTHSDLIPPTWEHNSESGQ